MDEAKIKKELMQLKKKKLVDMLCYYKYSSNYDVIKMEKTKISKKEYIMPGDDRNDEEEFKKWKKELEKTGNDEKVVGCGSLSEGIKMCTICDLNKNGCDKY